MEYRIEHDTMGAVRVPAEHFWGAQTERSLENFRIGTETIPREVIHAFAVLKSAAASANRALGKLLKRKPVPSWKPVETFATASIRRSFH